MYFRRKKRIAGIAILGTARERPSYVTYGELFWEARIFKRNLCGGDKNVEVILDSGAGYVNIAWTTTNNSNGSIGIYEVHPLFAEDWVDSVNNIENHTVKGFVKVQSYLYDGDNNPTNFTLTYADVADGDAVPFITNTEMTNAGIAQVGSVRAYGDGRYLDLQVKSTPEINECYSVIVNGDIVINAMGTNVQDVMGYHIERLTTNGWVQINTNLIVGAGSHVDYISMVDTASVAGVTNDYRIVVVMDGYGVTNTFSNRVAEIFQMESESLNGINWVDIRGAGSYRVEKSVTVTGTWELLDVVSTNTYPLTPDQSNGFYRVWIDH